MASTKTVATATHAAIALSNIDSTTRAPPRTNSQADTAKSTRTEPWYQD